MKTELDEVKVGIVGCGHLGQAFLASLIRQGVSGENLYISYSGNPATYERINRLGLAGCIVDNEKLLSEADIVFLLVKPQDVTVLKHLPFSKTAPVVSGLAGFSTEELQNIFGSPVVRMMVSGPDTIVAQKGIAALYPYNEFVARVLAKMGIAIAEISEESEIDIFTVGVCLPAVLLMENDEAIIKAAVAEIAKESPIIFAMYEWAKGVVPSCRDESKRAEYIARMATKGGVTEAIVTSLRAGEPLLSALQRGVARSRAISREMGSLV